MSERRWFDHTSEEIYGYRTRKPHAVVGLPLIGRHWGYVGRTNNAKRRDAQHRYGYVWDGERKPAKCWVDLEPRRFVICAKKRRMEITTHFLEWFWIKLLMPVYNVSMNGSNPRRIKPWTQAAQRRHRDQFGASAAVVPTVLKLGAFSVIALAVLALVQIGR